MTLYHKNIVGSFLLLITLCAVLIFFIGYEVGTNAINKTIKCIRLDGYDLISPLISCDPTTSFTSAKVQILQQNLTFYIQNEINANKIAAASVYIRNYNDGSLININPDIKYYPASLNKVPLMITLYKMNEANPGFFDQTHLWSDTTNYNDGIEIQPQETLHPGNTYSIRDALQLLMVDSDNDAYAFLIQYVSLDVFKQTFQDLKIPFMNTPAYVDYMTAEDFSYFLRVLRNATYLSRTDSENALELLIETNYDQGIDAGVPKSIRVADKFGVGNKELHDCGIIYAPKPYLLCVMTKGSQKLTDDQNAIQTISKMTYKELEN